MQLWCHWYFTMTPTPSLFVGWLGRWSLVATSTERVTMKFPLDARTYARFHSNSMPVPIPVVRPYPYLSYTCNQSMRVFVMRWISAIRHELFNMFAERSTCYFCLLSVRVRGFPSHLQRVHSSWLVPSAFKDGLFRLRKAENSSLAV